MPLDQADRVERVQGPCDQIVAAVNDLPLDLQMCAIGAALTAILRRLSEKRQAIEACEFIRTTLNVLREDDEDE